MKFLNPFGLLGLIGIPILIVLYIIKQKYVQRDVSSTYIWRRSMLFYRRKIKWQWINKFGLLILQIILVLLISFSIAQPVINSDKSEEELIIILDTSASMGAGKDSETRLERAIEMINERAKKLDYNSSITIIAAADEASYVVKHCSIPKEIEHALEKVKVSNKELNMEKALEVAKDYKGNNELARFVIYSDTDYIDVADSEIINLSQEGEFNRAVLSTTVSKINEDFNFTATVASYGKDDEFTVLLDVDGEIIDAKKVNCKAGEETVVTWRKSNIKDFEKVKVEIDKEDCIKEDNEYISYGNDIGKKVLLISDKALYIKNALRTIDGVDVTVVQSMEEMVRIYGPELNKSEIKESDLLKGYDLYIFDGYCPNYTPADGAIFYVNPTNNVMNLSLSGTVTVENGSAKIINSTDDDIASQITKNLIINNYDICEYIKASNTEGFTSVMRVNADDVLLVGETANYEKCTILLFDLHNSQLPVVADFPILMNNIVKYSLQGILDKQEYNIGDIVTVNLLKNCNELIIDEEHIAVDNKKQYSFSPDISKEYSVSELRNEKLIQKDYFFVHLSKNESNIWRDSQSLGLGETIVKEKVQELSFWEDLLSRAVNIWQYLAWALLVLLIIEWWVYYSEEY